MASNEGNVAMADRAERDSEPDAVTEVDLAELGKRLYEASGYDLGEHAAHIIRRAHQRATMRFQEVMGEHDLTPTQMAALATIMKHGELSQNQLGRLTAMDPSTISIVIRKLLKHDLVQRFASPEDQRLTIIRLTEPGVRYTAALLTKSVEVGRRVLAPLKPSERALFMEMMHRVADGEDVATGD